MAIRIVPGWNIRAEEPLTAASVILSSDSNKNESRNSFVLNQEIVPRSQNASSDLLGVPPDCKVSHNSPSVATRHPLGIEPSCDSVIRIPEWPGNRNSTNHSR